MAKVSLEVEAAAVVLAAELLGRVLRGGREPPAPCLGWELEVVAYLERWLVAPFGPVLRRILWWWCAARCVCGHGGDEAAARGVAVSWACIE